MINKCQFIGHVGADPEIKTVGTDTVANFRIGCSENWTDKNGQKQIRTEWISLVAWRKLAEIVEKYVKKGQLVYVEGRMTTRSWEDKDGAKRYNTEVVLDTLKMLGGKRDDVATAAPANETRREAVAQDGTKYNPDEKDDLPF